jgi:hypothetical protein
MVGRVWLLLLMMDILLLVLGVWMLIFQVFGWMVLPVLVRMHL